MSIVGFDRHGLPRPAMTIRTVETMGKRGRVAQSHPAVAVLGKMIDGTANLTSLMFVLEDGFLLELPLDQTTLRQLRAVLGEPNLPDDDPELTKPSWA